MTVHGGPCLLLGARLRCGTLCRHVCSLGLTSPYMVPIFSRHEFAGVGIAYRHHSDFFPTEFIRWFNAGHYRAGHGAHADAARNIAGNGNRCLCR